MFSYSMQTSIVFGLHESTRLAHHIRTVSPVRNWFVVTDPGIVEAGLVRPILDNLHAENMTTHIFAQVAQNPRDTDCVTGAEQFRQVGADAVLAIGGGSAMDTGKTIALLANGGGTPQEYYEGKRPYRSTIPIVCVPTTAGTGSEVTRSAVITEDASHRKLTLKHAVLRPLLAVVDPVLTSSVPQSVAAATGVDALVHAIEGYTCTLRSPITQAFGARAMQTIVPALPQVIADGTNLHAREQMMQGSLLAGLCFGSADVAAVHCLAEGLGSVYDTPHGVANAIFLPEVLRFNAASHSALHADIARHMGFASAADSEVDATAKMIEGIEEFTQSLRIPKLRELGYVKEQDFERIVELAVENGSTPSNVRPINATDYRSILDRVFAR